MYTAKAFFTNYVLMSTVCAWFIAQFLKMVTTLFKERKFKPSLLLFSSGGMPSSHSATVGALCTSSAINFGFGSFEFAVSAILAMVVVTDAMGVRWERVANVKGVTYINDSKATNVNSCWYALQSMTTPVVLILGGKDKGNDYTEIEALVKEKVSALICLGVDNSKLHAFFDGKVSHIEDAGSMKEAVEAAYRLAKKGDTVLLSPCCASFDLFKSYEDRGTQFKEMVKSL